MAPRRSAFFDPAPLLRQLELTLPDLRQPVRSTWAFNRGCGFDDGRKRVLDGQIAAALGVTCRAVQRWRTGGVRLNRVRADHLAVRLGLHPCLLWPEWYGDDAA